MESPGLPAKVSRTLAKPSVNVWPGTMRQCFVKKDPRVWEKCLSKVADPKRLGIPVVYTNSDDCGALELHYDYATKISDLDIQCRAVCAM